MLEQIKKDEWGGLSLGRRELYCGDVLQVLTPTDTGAQMVTTRLEMADDWYFVGLPDIDVAGCFARMA